MSTVEDVRQRLQNYVAPELRALTVRLDAIDRKTEALRTEMNLRLETQNSRLEAALAKQDTKVAFLEAKIDTRFAVIERKIQHVIGLMDMTNGCKNWKPSALNSRQRD